MLRLFDIARLRHNLPARKHGLYSVSRDPPSLALRTSDTSTASVQSVVEEYCNSPSENKRTPGKLSRHREIPIGSFNGPAHQEEDNMGHGRISNSDTPHPSQKDVPHQPHGLLSLDAIPATQRGDPHRVHVDYLLSSATPKHPMSHNGFRPPMFPNASDLVDHEALSQIGRPGESILRHGNHPSADTRRVLEYRKWKTLQQRSIARPAPVGLEPMWRETSLDLDSDEDVVDQLFWKDEVKQNDPARLPVINYSHPRQAILPGSNLPLVITTDTEFGRATLPTRYRSGVATTAVSYTLLPRGSSGTDSCLSNSSVDWELSAFDDEDAADEIIYSADPITHLITRTSEHIGGIALTQGKHIDHSAPHRDWTQTNDSGDFVDNSACVANEGPTLQHNTTRRESVVWTVD